MGSIIVRRTKEQAAETGRQILVAAEDLFLNKGYDNVSLEEIAAAAGVTRGAVHWHFKSKQGLLVALRETAQKPFRQLAENLSERASPASLTKLGDVISDIFERLQTDPRQQGLLRVMMRLDITLFENDEEGGTTFREEMHKIIARIFGAVERDAGLPPPWNSETAAAALGATIGGLVSEWAMGRGALRLVPEGQILIRMILSHWVG